MFKVLFETNFLVAIANVVMAIIAIIAANIAIKQLNNSKIESRIATAKNAYQEYLKLCSERSPHNFPKT
ncbi:hypothetical protein P3607_16415 [Vibrio parahaemolyticus]|uniref:hypothetical protein n=1 Tax=Vibrio parahaemolyticus TaxID=670 RepID=UPI0020696695|nr:hypothetical protein [Vibrio parahaemolyticus]MDF4920634.1 hypothetical protein [Vibrio parahaemolyticus]MDF5594647.1 hypothetical protein [Vibrio parahaemolyticus]MDG3058563.1 hypothetical protein [Vibrio parahaemolyticus]UPR17681.1 hypothetical protein H9J99_23295 [Vibrio parahaemolyticus]UPR23680.1 hypothetical protein H9J98_20315 [Vibrio parahaemolyticus]